MMYTKKRVTKVPLGKMPLMNYLYQRVDIDLLGPITSASTQGNKYILPGVDNATQWPEAVAFQILVQRKLLTR